MRFPRFVSALAAALVMAWLAGCVTVAPVAPVEPPPRKTTLSADRVVLPTTASNGYLLVDVHLNGTGPYRLLVDTGASWCLLSKRVADAAGIKVDPSKQTTVGNAAGDRVDTLISEVDRFESGGLVVEGLTVAVGTDAAMAALTTLVKVDGLVGINVFKDAVLELDFPAGQVVVARRSAGSYPAEAAVSYTGERPVVALDVAGKATPMLIDTGFGGLLKLPAFEGVPLLTAVAKSEGAGAVYGTTYGGRGANSQLAGDVKLGPLTWVNPPVVVGPKSRTYGLIGVQALQQVKLVVDPGAKRVYFVGQDVRQAWEKQEASGDTRFNLGFYADIEGTALRLLEVDPDSAADLAGLRAGDLVLTVDDAPAVGHEVESTRSRLRVRREDREFETHLVLAPDYAPRQVRFAEDRVALPVVPSRIGLVIEARINGRGPFRFLVSTRARALTVSPAVVEAAGLKPLPDWQPGGQTSDIVWVGDFASGGFELQGLAAVVFSPAGHATANAVFGPVDGVLGLEVLRDIALEIDVPRKAVMAVKAGSGAYPAERAIAYPGGLPRIEMDFAGKSERMLLDTTSNGGFELPSLDEFAFLYPLQKIDGILTGAGVRQERAQFAHEAKLGPITWSRPPLTRGTVARIGLTALAPWRIVIDQPARKVYLLDGPVRRVANEVKPPEPGARLGYFARRDGAELKIIEVDPGEAFDRAGVRVGDAIVAIDGVSISDYMREPSPFALRRGAAPVLRLRREGMELETRLIRAAPAAP